MKAGQNNMKVQKGKRFIHKYIIITAIFFAALFSMSVSSHAANEGITAVKGENGKSIIYIQNNENTNFEFAYTNDNTIDKNTLTYQLCAQDTLGNNIAYVNSTNNSIFGTTTYMYARTAGTQNYIVNGIVLDLSKQIDLSTLSWIGSITKQISVATDQSVTTTNNNNGIACTLTQGKIILTDTSKQYEYIMVKASADSNYTNFLNIINLMSKFNNNTGIVTRIETYSAFSQEYNALEPEAADTNWVSAANNEIIEPEDTQDSDIYVVWIKDEKTGTVDMQMMKAKQQYSEDKIKAAMAEELPYTGDNNTLLKIWGVLIILIVIVTVLIHIENNKRYK